MTILIGPTELRSILTFTVNLARMAGTLMLEGSQAIQSASDIDVKKNSVDLVTEYDIAVENLVKSEIEKVYPNFGLYVLNDLCVIEPLIDPCFLSFSIGEESYSSGVQPELTDEPTFCVDPIGGSSMTTTDIRIPIA